MTECSGSNNLDCDCVTTSLSAIDIALPPNGDNFPFRSLVSGTLLQVNQTPSGIILNVRKPLVGVYIGLQRSIQFNILSINPLIFNNINIPGYYNSGAYNMLTGIFTAPSTDFYNASVQIITEYVPPFLPSGFVRQIQPYVNGVPFNPAIFKTSFSNETMSLSGTYLLQLNAGDTVQFALDIGAPLTYVIGADSYLSISKQ